MQYTIAAAAFFAGLVAAAPQAAYTTSTVMTTETHTITSCAPTVTECPASTSVTSYAVVTTVPIVKAPVSAYTTSTILSTEMITITECAETVTNCPARTSATTYAVVTTVPVTQNALTATGGAAYPSGTGCPGGCNGGASNTYHMPSATGAYNGPSFTGAASHLNAGAALAGVGALAAFIL